MSVLKRLFGGQDARHAYAALYAGVVREGRDPVWYMHGGVPDTIDGRFDMIAAVLSLVLLRLEREDARAPSALLTELFVEDMDGQLRQIGVGDLVVGKHIGQMMGMLGGRLAAYREALAPGGDLAGALDRNLWRGNPPDAEARGFSGRRLLALNGAIAAAPLDRLLSGEVPVP